MKIFLDDIRQEPDGWRRTLHAGETVSLLKQCQDESVPVEALSLDNDLGLGEPEGRTVLDWLEEQAFTVPCFRLPDRILVHSANAPARQRMEAVIARLERLR